MFHLTQPVKAKVTNVEVLSQKNREPDDDPGVKLSISLMVTNYVLELLDPRLKAWLYDKKPNGAQAGLNGVEAVSDMPSLSDIGQKVGTLPWNADFTGYEIDIDYGMGGERNLKATDGVINTMKLIPKAGGTVQMKFKFESPNVGEAEWGKFAKLKSREVSIVIPEPVIAEDPQRKLAVDGKAPAAKKTAKAPAAPAGAKEPNRGDDPSKWPFPRDGKPQGVVPDAPDATSTFIEAQSGGQPQTERRAPPPAAAKTPARKVGRTTVVTKRARGSTRVVKP